MKQLVQIAIAVPRCLWSRNMLLIRASVDGARVAPAIPRAARAAINIDAFTEKAATTEAIPNAAAPISRRRLRPIRSPSVPIVTRNPASMKA